MNNNSTKMTGHALFWNHCRRVLACSPTRIQSLACQNSPNVSSSSGEREALFEEENVSTEMLRGNQIAV
jgi:hypothetical protein